jgi:L-ascorbate metabolism protein UlaG (beta-lactamase superfamily)
MFVAAGLFSGCAGNLDQVFKEGAVRNTNPKVTRAVYKEEQHTFKYDSLGGSALKITYLGSGGFIFERDSFSLMVDPYFSHQNIFKLAFSKLLFLKTLKTDWQTADKALANFKGKTNSIWVSHAHYDHLMDVPYVYSKYANKQAKIYTSQSGANNLKHVTEVNNVVVLDSNNISFGAHVGQPFYLENKRIKISPILAEHAPHLGSCKFYKGTAKPNKKYNSPLKRTRAEFWKEGLTFSYVFDFLDENEAVEFRIFLQSSATNAPIGFMPNGLKEDHPVNLAIIASANFDNANNFPCRLIHENLNPQRLMICHWEDFFRPYSKEIKKSVRATNLKKYLQVLNHTYPWLDSNGVEQFILPKPGAVLHIE